jgi:uncharacterized protein YkwD
MKLWFHKFLKSILVISVILSLNDFLVYGIYAHNLKKEDEEVTDLVDDVQDGNKGEVELDVGALQDDSDDAAIDDSEEVLPKYSNQDGEAEYSDSELQQATIITNTVDAGDEEVEATDSSNARTLNSTEVDKIKDNLIASVNDARVEASVNVEVVESSTLDKTSSIRSEEIEVEWAHERPNGTSWETVLTENGISLSGLKAGEDLAKVSTTAKSTYSDEFINKLSTAIHSTLMGSTTHKKVILNQNYRQIGVGIATQIVDGKLNVYVTEHFKNVPTVSKPKGTSLSSLKATKKGFTVKWKKQATQTNGYQIQYSTSSKFSSGNKTVTISKNSTVSRNITKLLAKKKYYVRIRTYKKVNGKTYYSSWSSAKSVTTKK